ncbi:helix-turn-helix domain-containing protein [Anaerosinus massiliensis]|uniref:helix-turn-helix domain-containing protein n=1 Tax=Massilibacillus massiliensis TaxID=1806837 RepID=UPI000DA5F7F6|nr:helix-turn-helix transcriptional regulator [Massilibacillus massiliensis]
MLKHKCKRCGKETKDLDGWYLECDCERESIHNSMTDDFKYVCASCGELFTGDNENGKQCPGCGALEIICFYKDGETEVNKTEYKTIIKNLKEGKNFRYICDCGYTKMLYASNIHNVMCDCCDNDKLMMYMPEDLAGSIKKHRKLHRMNQTELAELLKISRSQLGRIEKNEIPIPEKIMHRVLNFLATK